MAIFSLFPLVRRKVIMQIFKNESSHPEQTTDASWEWSQLW